MSRILLNTKTWLLFVLLLGISLSAWAQSDDFNTWTKFMVIWVLAMKPIFGIWVTRTGNSGIAII